MKLGPKLALVFAAMAVLPLAAASAVFLNATEKLGVELVERGRQTLEDRLRADIRRSVEEAGIAAAEDRRRIEDRLRFLATDMGERISAAAPERDIAGRYVYDDNGGSADDGTGIDRYRATLAPDAAKDAVRGILLRLADATPVSRSVHFRTRGLVAKQHFVFENGLTLTYPADTRPAQPDLREADWYVRAVETGGVIWSSPRQDGDSVLAGPALVMLHGDGTIAGVAVLRLRLKELLARALGPARLPNGAKAFVATTNEGGPVTVAAIDVAAREWLLLPTPAPLAVAGDDAAALRRDIMDGAPGIARLSMDGQEWIQAYGPIGKFGDRTWTLVVALPYSVVDEIRSRADTVVKAAFSSQLIGAAVFAAVAALLAVLTGLFAARSLTRPIRRLHDAASRLALGDYTVRIDADGKDELGDLARGFNRMVPAIEDQVRTKKELNLAREIQQNLVPVAAPALPGFDVAGRTVFCAETGGDYLDFIPITVGTGEGLAVIAGDMTGHGAGAALLMTTARATLRTAVEAGMGGGETISTVNRQLARDAGGGRFMTMFATVLRAESRSIDWISAGHEPAILYDPPADRFQTLAVEDIPLGIDTEWQYRAEKLTLPAGGILVSFTDGIRECKSPDGRDFGADGVEAAVRAAKDRDSAAICEEIFQRVSAHQGGLPAGDDMTVLVIRVAAG